MTAERTRATPEEEGLDLVRWGTRFARESIEREYLAWNARLAIPRTLLAALA